MKRFAFCYEGIKSVRQYCHLFIQNVLVSNQSCIFHFSKKKMLWYTAYRGDVLNNEYQPKVCLRKQSGDTGIYFGFRQVSIKRCVQLTTHFPLISSLIFREGISLLFTAERLSVPVYHYTCLPMSYKYTTCFALAQIIIRYNSTKILEEAIQ